MGQRSVAKARPVVGGAKRAAAKAGGLKRHGAQNVKPKKVQCMKMLRIEEARGSVAQCMDQGQNCL